MGILSSLFGGKVSFPTRGSGEEKLYEYGLSAAGEADSQRSDAQGYLASLGNTKARESAARGRATADVWAGTANEPSFDPSHPTVAPIQRTMTRTAALSRMGFAGADNVKMQSFQEKLGAAQYGRTIRRTTLNALGALTNISNEGVASDMRNSQARAGQTADFAGTLVGAGIRGYQGWRANQNNITPVTVTAQKIGT